MSRIHFCLVYSSHIVTHTTRVMPIEIWSFQRRALFQIEYQPKSSVAIQIVSMQPLTPYKAQSLIQLQTRCIRNLRLKHYLIRVTGRHGINSQSNKLRSYPATPIFLLRREHGDVAAVCA